jgi:conjugal transfer pilus assembly protein TraE
MEYKTAISKLKLLSGRLNYMLLMSVGLLISNIFLIWLTTWSLMHQKRTIVPAEIRQPFTISDAVVDASYLRQMALLFATQRLNITPSAINHNHSIILQHVDPRFYHDFVGILDKERQEVTDQNISSVFYPEEIIPNTKNLSVILKGTLARWVGALTLPPVKKSYIVSFSYKSGELKVLSFAEKLEDTK